MSDRLVLSEPNWRGNSSFHPEAPVQLLIDSTALGEFKLCPRRYQLGIVEGWRPIGESPHLVFGQLLHSSIEAYWHSRAGGASHEEALDAALDLALRATWNTALSRPWLSGHPAKNRLSLLRTLVWYLDERSANDPLATIHLADGRPAVELAFQVPVGLRSATGDEFALCGRIDRLASMGDDVFPTDVKTTSGALNQSYFQGYTPDNQVSLYVTAVNVMWGLPARGLIIDAAQIGITFTRFERGIVLRSEAAMDEWLVATRWWLGELDRAALRGEWPQNDKNCRGPYGDCPFRPVCARRPGERARWLEVNYQRRRWDPAASREGGQTE